MYIEPIEQMLDSIGDTLTFPTYTIKAFLGISISMLASDNSSYITERRDFTAQAATQAVVTNSTADGDSFTMTDGLYVYSFTLTSDPVPDMSGFSKLTFNYVGKASV
jgi:hypothetical protein